MSDPAREHDAALLGERAPSPPLVRVDKPRGLSPGQAIARLRARLPALAPATLGYAGRLDPLAEGLLLVLVGDENKRAQDYCRLDKAYELDVLLGARTDTYDALGLATLDPLPEVPGPAALARALARFEGAIVQPYPPYSAARVAGRPMFYWARRGLAREHAAAVDAAGPVAGSAAPVAPPARTRVVHALELAGVHALGRDELACAVARDVASVAGDFRQPAIAARWRELLASPAAPAAFTVVALRVACSSGTYMRGIAHALGGALGGGAMALRIRRTRVGPHTLVDAVAV